MLMANFFFTSMQKHQRSVPVKLAVQQTEINNPSGSPGYSANKLYRMQILPVSDKVKSFRLRFFGYLSRSTPEKDHHCVIAAAALRPPTDCRGHVGRPGTTRLRTIDKDVQPQSTRHG